MANFPNSNIRRYSIETGIPIAPLKSAKNIYPFATMSVGDSFALAEGNIREVERVRAAACYWGLRHAPMKFAVRISDPSIRAYRCWRIA